MSVLDSIAKVIEVGKQLKKIADRLDDVEIKSQMLDVVFQLQEVHDTILVEWEGGIQGSNKDGRPAESVEDHDKGFLLTAAEKKKARIEPTGAKETYSIVVVKPQPLEAVEIVEIDSGQDEGSDSNAKEANSDGESSDPSITKVSPAVEPETAVAVEEVTDVAVDLKSGKTAEADTKTKLLSDTDEIQTKAAKENTSEMTPEKRAQLAEFRISELEPLQQAALKKVNDVLTEKQQRIKASATKAARKAGKKGKDLQQQVLAAMKLTDEQKEKMALARKELHDVRMSIAKEIQHLMSEEQKAKIKANLGIR